MKTTAVKNNMVNGKADHSVDPVISAIKINGSAASAAEKTGGKDADVKLANGVKDAGNSTSDHLKNEAFKSAKPVMNLEQTLKLVADLAKKTAQRDRYNGYIDQLKSFVIAQTDEDDMAKNDTSFKGCELVIRDGDGNVFRTESAAVIGGTVEFMTGRFSERLAEVEAEIVIPS